MKASIFQDGYWKEKNIECQHNTDLIRRNDNMLFCPTCQLLIPEEEWLKSQEFKQMYD